MAGASPSASETAALDEILEVLRAAFGVDFSEYKDATFERRVASRMARQGTAAVPDYAALLREDPNEVRQLHDDLLIHVTSFFRDPAVFEALALAILPGILTRKHAAGTVRVWVAGCATGEEVYSLAILLLESLGGDPRQIHVIGTDVDHAVLAKARTGVYSDAALAGMNADRRERYFVRAPGGRRINETVHDLCSFFQHDLARDPPFAHLDLVSCRNVIMYFNRDLQKRVLASFHYALEQPGFLLLGRAEGVVGSSHLFSSVDDRSRVFGRKATASALRFAGDLEARLEARSKVRRDRGEEADRPRGLARFFDRTLLKRYVPPGVLINDRMQILEFRGQTGAYLELPPGDPSDDIMRLIRHELRSPLRAAIERTKSQTAPVRMCGVRVRRPGAAAVCDLVVARLPGLTDTTESLYTVMFEPTEPAATSRALRSANHDLRSRNTELERINDDLRDRLSGASEARDDAKSVDNDTSLLQD